MENIYLDNAATTKMCEEALCELIKCERSFYGNPSSLHLSGQRAAAKTEAAREYIADVLNTAPATILFTSGATEANNLCIAGYAYANSDRGRHIITDAAEHPSVLNTCKALEKQGFEVTYLKVDKNCEISLSELKDAIREDTILVSIMHTNNEVGTINPVEEIGKITKQSGVAFHCDCVQAMGKELIDVKKYNIDMLSASAHKFNGPKGVGFLYAAPSIKLSPIIFGGEQERSLRPGTINAPAISAMSAALKLSYTNPEQTAEHIRKLSERLISGVKENIPSAHLNGSAVHRTPGNVNFSFPSVSADSLLYALDMAGVRASAGSACSSGSLNISHVIKAMGVESLGAPMRFSLGRYTTDEEIECAVKTISEVYHRLSLS